MGMGHFVSCRAIPFPENEESALRISTAASYHRPSTLPVLPLHLRELLLRLSSDVSVSPPATGSGRRLLFKIPPKTQREEMTGEIRQNPTLPQLSARLENNPEKKEPNEVENRQS